VVLLPGRSARSPTATPDPGRQRDDEDDRRADDQRELGHDDRAAVLEMLDLELGELPPVA